MSPFRPLLLAAVSAVLALPFAVGCSAETGATDDVDSTEDELRTSYGEFGEVLESADYDRWIGVRRAIIDGFDAKCGDTICSGDFSNLTSVRLTCSASSKMRKMRDCVWVLGGSIEYVDPITGTISTDARTFTCKIPVASTARRMLDALSAAGSNAIDTTLPGTNGSFYDGLTACFSGVVGHPPPAQVEGPFVDLQEFLWNGGGDGSAFNATQRKLAKGFDDVCGDTFCEGDYSDISALRLVCAVDTSTTKVRSCSWSFAAANTSLAASGKFSADTDERECSVTLDAAPSALVQALSGDDPLNATLPGLTTSLYDSLIDCL